MEHLTRDTLLSLEEYSNQRTDFRKDVMAHKKNRQVIIGAHATLYFEDIKTMQYQIQEMLRIERIFEAQAIQEELDTYNPLIPDGSNLKATFMLEYSDIDERKIALSQLKGVEKTVWIKIGDNTPVYPIANEDLERSNDEKTSAVHFFRFEFTDKMIEDAKNNMAISMGISHPNYDEKIDSIEQSIRKSLVSDFL